MEIFETYLGKTASEHELKWNSLKSQGYRFISLSVYGGKGYFTPLAFPDFRFAAVLVKRVGLVWEHTTGSLNSLKDEIAGYRNRGYAPTIISIAGGGEGLNIYAAVWEKGAFAEGWIAEYDLKSGSDFFSKCDSAKENGCYLVSATVYGITDPRYAAIWARYSDTQPIRWFINVTDDEYQSKRWHSGVAQLQYRPSLAVTSLAPPSYSWIDTPLSEIHRRYLSVFRDDSVGEYRTAHNLTEEQYGSVLDENKNTGFYPTCIQGSVIGDDTRYAVIFGQNDRPYDRKWTVTPSQPTSIPSLAGIDEVIKDYMQNNGIRAGVLVIQGKDGKIKLLHGYTWAEPEYPITQPDSLFRIASVSKMFACAAIQTLYDKNKLEPTTKVFPTLGIDRPAIEDQKPDTQINNIEVQHLVDHLGGWARSISGDPILEMRNIALRLKLPKQLTKIDFARYMYGQKLDFTPGGKAPKQPGGNQDADTYSNFGYILLGMLVEKMTSMSFIDFLRKEVLRPINITDVFLARSLKTQRADNEVFYDDPGLGLSAVDRPGGISYASDDLVPYAYGGIGYITEIMDSSGGLISTAKALVQFASRYPVLGIGKGRSPDHKVKDGSMPGTKSLVVSRGDGVDYAYIFNSSNEIPRPGRVRVSIEQKINEFLHNKIIE